MKNFKPFYWDAIEPRMFSRPGKPTENSSIQYWNTLSCVLLCLIAVLAGCQTQSHPWAGIPYQAPSEIQQNGQSTFAPMPSILPSVESSKYGPGLEVSEANRVMDEVQLDELDELEVIELGKE